MKRIARELHTALRVLLFADCPLNRDRAEIALQAYQIELDRLRAKNKGQVKKHRAIKRIKDMHIAPKPRKPITKYDLRQYKRMS